MSRNRGDLGQSAERRTMTDETSNRFARAARDDQFFPFGDTAGRHVSNKSGVRIAALGPGWVLRQFDNPIANRLLPATRQRHAHEMYVDESFWHVIGFDDRLPNFR